MSRLSILNREDRLAFDEPPKFNKALRRAHFALSPASADALRKMRTTVNKTGFLVQLAYFKSSKRFYRAELFRPKDVRYALGIVNGSRFEPEQYIARTARHHQKLILKLTGWSTIGDEGRADLEELAERYATDWFPSIDTFSALVERCHTRHWAIPSYTELSEIITKSILATEREELHRLSLKLTDEHRSALDGLMTRNPEFATSPNRSALHDLSSIEHKPSQKEISRNASRLSQLQWNHDLTSGVLEALSLSDRAIEYYGEWTRRATEQQLQQFLNPDAIHLRLLCFVEHHLRRLNDHAAQSIINSVKRATNRSERRADEQLKKAAERLAIENLKLHSTVLSARQLVASIKAVHNQKNVGDAEKYRQIAQILEDNDKALRALEAAAKESESVNAMMSGSASQRSLVHLRSSSLSLQRRVTPYLAIIRFAEEPSNPLLDAIQYFQANTSSVWKNAPTAFLEPFELKAVLANDRFDVSLYKALLFKHVVSGLKSRSISIPHSYRFRSLDDSLISPAEWAVNRTGLLREAMLEDYEDVDQVMESIEEALSSAFERVNANIASGKNQYATLRPDKRVSVSTPRTDKTATSVISEILGMDDPVSILDVLKAADRYTGFTKCFQHHSVKNVKLEPKPIELIAGVLAYGCNIGVRSLARISKGINGERLVNIVNWFFDRSNIYAANRVITEAIHKLALPSLFMELEETRVSSSDGRKLPVAGASVFSRRSFKYLGKAAGVNDYTFQDERGTFFHALVFSATDRDAPYVLDGLIGNAVRDQHLHATDTYGVTDHVFAASFLLGYTFAPRFKRTHRVALVDFQTKGYHTKLGHLITPSRKVKTELIKPYWDDILRLIATLTLKRANASDVLKALSSYAKDHPLYIAMKELGRLVKTKYVLEYQDDVKLRQRVQKILNLGEQGQKMARTVFWGKKETFQVPELDEQNTRVACRILVQNTIILWNYLRISEYVAKTKPKDREELLQSIAAGSMIAFDHVNLGGEYLFTAPSSRDPYFDIKRIERLKLDLPGKPNDP